MKIFLLYHDDDYFRASVAEQGYRLDILINDPHWQVRHQVAIQGYGLNILINDPDERIRETARAKQNEIHNSNKIKF